MTVNSRELVPAGGMNGRVPDLERHLDNLPHLEENEVECETCLGTGELYVETEFQHEYDGHTEIPCTDCGGKGVVR